MNVPLLFSAPIPFSYDLLLPQSMDLSDIRSSNTYDLDAPYSSLTGRGASNGRQRGFVGCFKGRKVWWWIWGFVRVSCLVLVIVFMALLLNNFYVNGGGHCSWCRYLRYSLGFLSQSVFSHV